MYPRLGLGDTKSDTCRILNSPRAGLYHAMPSHTRRDSCLLRGDYHSGGNELALSVEAGTQSSNFESAGARFGNGLYGLEALLNASTAREYEAILRRILEQECAHVGEGLSLPQMDIRELTFDGSSIIDPYTGQAMVQTSRNALEAAIRHGSPDGLVTRLECDKAAEEAANDLMRSGLIGDGFWRVIPFADEESPAETGKLFGMWPKMRRSYLMLYRRSDHDRVEVTSFSVDKVPLAKYDRLLMSRGEDSSRYTSHEISGVLVRVNGLFNHTARERCVEGILSELGVGHYGYTVQDFLSSHHQAIERIVYLTDALSESISGQLHPHVLESIHWAIRLMASFGYQSELAGLVSLQRADKVDLEEHRGALELLINLERYGVQRYLDKIISGEVESHGLDHAILYLLASQAFSERTMMPGCPGGFGPDGMLSWHGGGVRVGKCTGCSKSSLVGVEGWCYECISGHCGM